MKLTQIVTPEMAPTFARTVPTSGNYYLLPGIDYTYSLTINETTGLVKGISYASNRINSAVNTETTITIPVPEGFTLDAKQTAAVNAFTDGTTITQPDGKSGDIIISVPKGSGSQNYEDENPYRIVGFYDLTQPMTDTTVKANSSISVDQTITKADGSTYHLTENVGTWQDTLMGVNTNSQDLTLNVSAYPYVTSKAIPIDVDTSAPLNLFGFANPTSENLTNSQIKLTFPDGFQIGWIKTPVDAVYLPGTTSYGYTITYTDGTTGSGTVAAGDSVIAAAGKYIQSIIFTPNLVAAGAQTGGSSQQDKNLMFEAYGTIADKLSDGTVVANGHEFDSAITMSYDNGKKTTFNTASVKQTASQRTTSLTVYGKEQSQMPGVTDAGYLSIWRTFNYQQDTVHSIYEPIFYYVLPEYTSYNGDLTDLITEDKPKVSTFMVGNRQVVKIDYTGTGANIPTDQVSKNYVHLTNSSLAPNGSYRWDIYVYSPQTALSNEVASQDDNWTSDETEGKTDNVYHIGGDFWTIGVAKQVSVNTGSQGNTNDNVVMSGTSDDKGSPAMSFQFNVTNTIKDLTSAVAIVDLSKDNTATFELTGPVTLANGESANVLYSTSHYTDGDTGSGAQPDLTTFVTADQITDWSTVKAIAIRLGSMAVNQSSQTYIINGQDPTIAEDAGKSIGLDTYLYADQMNPASGKMADNATIKITGTSTVTARVAYQDANGNTEYLDLPDLTKTYQDNSSVMKQSDFALTDADKTAINSLISQLNDAAKGQYIYQLVEVPTIVNGKKTWQTDAANDTASFADATPVTASADSTTDNTVKYYYDSDIVQYQLVKVPTQKINYTVKDVTTGETLTSGTFTGVANSAVSAADQKTYNDLIKQYQNAGYVVTADELPKFDDDNETDQTVVITVAHQVQQISGNSTDIPTNSEIKADDLKKTATLNVNYVNSDGTPFTGTKPANASQTITLIGSTYIDLVTGKQTNAPVTDANGHKIVDTSNKKTPTITWTPATTTAVTSPIETGYHPMTTEVPVISVSMGDAESGLTDQNATSVTITTDSQNPTIIRTVIYVKDSTAQVIYVDQDNGNNVIPGTGSGTLTGTAGQRIDYSTSTTISELENKGYELVSNGFDPEGIAPNYSNDTDTQTYTVTFKHKKVSVDPTDPKTPSDTLPDNPSQTYPEGVGKGDLNKDITRTINIHEPDGTVITKTQVAHLTRTATVDEVTGEVTYSDWTTGSWADFTDIPSLPGYVADQTVVAGQDVDVDTPNTTVDIYYTAVPDNPTRPADSSDSGNQAGASNSAAPNDLVDSAVPDNIENEVAQRKLPQTGNRAESGVLGLALTGLAALLGLTGYKKKRDED